MICGRQRSIRLILIARRVQPRIVYTVIITLPQHCTGIQSTRIAESRIVALISFQVKIVRESDHKLVLHEHGHGVTSVVTFEIRGEHLFVVSV